MDMAAAGNRRWISRVGIGPFVMVIGLFVGALAPPTAATALGAKPVRGTVTPTSTPTVPLRTSTPVATPTTSLPTSTPSTTGSPALLFSDTFDSGSLSGWSASIRSGSVSSVAATGGAAYAGAFGLDTAKLGTNDNGHAELDENITAPVSGV